MAKYEFQLLLSGIDKMTAEISNALFESGCDDGTPYSCDGVVGIGFTREADSLEQAIRSAVADVQKAGFAVAHVESAEEPVFSRINRELAKQ